MMLCPKCKAELVRGENRVFETLDEHVSNPNQESYPKRPTWVCKFSYCPCSKEDMFWDEIGALYGGYIKKNISYIDDNHAPFGSIWREINAEKEKDVI